MRFKRRLFQIITTQEIKTKDATVKLRVCAVLDPEEYRLRRLNNQKTVRIEKRVKGNTYEVLDSFESISTAETMFKEYIEKVKLECEFEDDIVTLFD